MHSIVIASKRLQNNINSKSFSRHYSTPSVRSANVSSSISFLWWSIRTTRRYSTWRDWVTIHLWIIMKMGRRNGQLMMSRKYEIDFQHLLHPVWDSSVRVKFLSYSIHGRLDAIIYDCRHQSFSISNAYGIFDIDWRWNLSAGACNGCITDSR